MAINVDLFVVVLPKLLKMLRTIQSRILKTSFSSRFYFSSTYELMKKSLLKNLYSI